RQSVLDRDRLRDIFGDDSAGLAKILDVAAESFTRLCRALEAAVSEADALGAAHELKGAAINIGAVQICAAAQAIEARLKAGETLDHVRPSFGVVNAALQRFKDMVASSRDL
ncbi:MAG TPA: Hpt domain-containing protein, partial [Candidatus Baltobacteraceae bacterium]|nr:Hpt domain-containing protein [Candidatus Baltobacteraceae bacterium]